MDEEFSNRLSTLPIELAVSLRLSPEEADSVLQGFEFPEESPAGAFATLLGTDRKVSFFVRCWKQRNAISCCITKIGLGEFAEEAGRLTISGIQICDNSEESIRNICQLRDAIISAELDIKAAEYVDANRNYLSSDFNNFFIRVDNTLGREGGAKVRTWFNEAANVATFINGIANRKNEAVKKRSVSIMERDQLFASSLSEGADPTVVKRIVELISKSVRKVFGERKQPIGERDAKQLLAWKTGRRDKESWNRVRTVTKALLDVDLEAFGGDGRPVEIEIGEFLPDATGAGIKESLRLIFDLENQKSDIALIEEPEVHLHPALARAVSNYLREKSADVQIFLTTHSTEFVDAATFQNVYLVSRNAAAGTHVQPLDTSTGVQAVPAELGLRPSTLFMHDCLVFVEGPSDEAVLREFARKLGLDLAKTNVGFIQLGGISNIKSYAAEEVIAALSRRNVSLWFVVDRDERDTRDIRKMKDLLGDRAHLCVLEARELENYLLDADAVLQFLAAKKLHSRDRSLPSFEELSRAMRDASLGLKEQAITLRLKKRLLSPIYPNTKEAGNELILDQLNEARKEIDLRLEQVRRAREAIQAEIEPIWSQNSMAIAPGAMILDGTCSRYGVRFDKSRGDSLRIAELMSVKAIPRWITETLKAIAKQP